MKEFIDETTFNKAFGTVIRDIAKQKGIRITKLETDCLLYSNFFGEMRNNGRRISLYNAHQICDYLGVSLEEITNYILNGGGQENDVWRNPGQ